MVKVVLLKSFGAFTCELFVTCGLLGRGLVLRLYPVHGLVGGELAQLDCLGPCVGRTVAPLFRVPYCTALPALGGDELRAGVVAEYLAGKASRFERLPFAGEA
jgi:hypothetical protein